MGEFANKVVLVTGAAGGIGLATAKAFAEAGAKVMLADINGEAVARQAEIINGTGGTASSLAVDVTDFQACEAMVQRTVEIFDGFDIAFNNAGISSSISEKFEDYTVDEWLRVLSVNVTGMFLAMKAEVPALKAHGGKVIVNTASVTSFIAGPGMASYIASKHAVAGLTKAVSLDLIKEGIRVNAVAPGIIDTPMLAHALTVPEIADAMNAQAPIGRVGRPEEIANAVLFLASEKSSYMVGEVMRVDGGLSLP